MSVIERIAKERTVEQIIENVRHGNTDNDLLKDLTQDIYYSLIILGEEKLKELENNNALNYYITRIVLNNINSKTSPFYYKYRKYYERNKSYDDENYKLKSF